MKRKVLDGIHVVRPNQLALPGIPNSDLAASDVVLDNEPSRALTPRVPRTALEDHLDSPSFESAAVVLVPLGELVRHRWKCALAASASARQEHAPRRRARCSFACAARFVVFPVSSKAAVA